MYWYAPDALPLFCGTSYRLFDSSVRIVARMYWIRFGRTITLRGAGAIVVVVVASTLLSGAGVLSTGAGSVTGSGTVVLVVADVVGAGSVVVVVGSVVVVGGSVVGAGSVVSGGAVGSGAAASDAV